jgi:hypothetical protein
MQHIVHPVHHALGDSRLGEIAMDELGASGNVVALAGDEIVRDYARGRRAPATPRRGETR